MTTGLTIVTVTTLNQLHRVRTLIQGVAAHVPEARRLVCCVDASPTALPKAPGAFEVVSAETLHIPRFRQLAFALPATGVCCLLKTQIVLHALSQPGTEMVLYVDNDIMFFRKPAEMLENLPQHDLIVTPHLLAPLPAGALPSEAVIRPYGVFNAGLFGVRNTPAARDFLMWWGRHLFEPAHSHDRSGWDQCWLDFAPSFLPRCSILRHAGYNVASWNLVQRPIRRTAAGWFAGDEPLTAFHFSSFNEAKPERLFMDGLTCNYLPTPEVAELSRNYARALVENGGSEFAALPYGFGSFHNGTPIRPDQRALFACELLPFVTPDDDPFDPDFAIGEYSGRQSLYNHRPKEKTILHRIVRRMRGLAARA